MPTAMKDSPFRLWNATGVTERAASLSTAEQNEHQEAEMGVSNVDNRRKREREREREREGGGRRERGKHPSLERRQINRGFALLTKRRTQADAGCSTPYAFRLSPY